jgi:hypothetical protein
MAISGTLTTSPRCLPNQGKLLQKESMVNQSHDSGVDSMNTNSSGNLKKYVDIFREFFISLKVLQFRVTYSKRSRTLTADQKFLIVC